MDKFPVYFRGKSIGEMTVEQGDCCAWFTVQTVLPKDELLCAWVLGERAELRLGILESTGFGSSIRRKFSERMVLPLGTIRSAEVRTVKTKNSGWEPVLKIETVFRSHRLRKCFLGQQGLLVKSWGEKRYIAVPYDKCKSFSAIELFCFARLVPIEEKEYLVILFNEEEQVVFDGS